jgi:hypothetical protein
MATASRRARKLAATAIGPPRRDTRQRRRSSIGPATITEDAPFQGASLTQPSAHAATGRRVVVSRPRPTATITSASRSACSARYGPTRKATPARKNSRPCRPRSRRPSPRRAVLTPGGPRPRRRPLAARKRGNPRPHPETERSVRGPAAQTTQVCKHPFGGGTPAKLDGSPTWSRLAIGRQRRGAHSRFYVSRLLAAGPAMASRSWRSVACCGCPSSRGLPSRAAAGAARVG